MEEAQIELPSRVKSGRVWASGLVSGSIVNHDYFHVRIRRASAFNCIREQLRPVVCGYDNTRARHGPS